jgi:methionyl-tRNA formyltransferase
MKLIFAGTPANAATALRALAAEHEIVLVITRDDAPVGRKREMTPSPVASAANDLGLTVLKRNRISDADIELLQQAGAERAIVVAYGALIPQAVLDVLPWWNLHFSLLPAWRGATPLQHSMISGGLGAGVTLFELEAGLDTGPIVTSAPIEIDFTKTCGELLDEFTQVGSDLTLAALKSAEGATAQQGEVTLAPKITRDAARLDLNDSADRIAWKVMALNPEPMAWVEVAGLPLRILRAASLGSTDWDALADHSSEVGGLSFAGGKVLVSCGGGTRLELKEVQPAGKKAMPAVDWYRGLNKETKLD